MEPQTAEDSDTYEALSIEEIKRRFNGEWVMLLDPMLGTGLEVLGGKLVCHSKDREAVHDKGVQLRPKSCAFLLHRQDRTLIWYLCCEYKSFDPDLRLILVSTQLFGPGGNAIVLLALDTGATSTVIRPKVLATIGVECLYAP